MKCHCGIEASPQSCSYGEVPWCIPHHSTSTPPKGPPCQPHSNLSHSRSQKRGRAKDLDTGARATSTNRGERHAVVHHRLDGIHGEHTGGWGARGNEGELQVGESKKKCFSNALGYTLVVLEVL